MAIVWNLTARRWRLIDNVMQAVNAPNADGETGAGQFTVSSTGTLAYVPGGIFPDRNYSFVVVDRTRKETAQPEPSGALMHLRVTADGQRLAFARSRRGERATDVWTYDLTRNTSTRLTSDHVNTGPVWSADGTAVLFLRIVGNDLTLQLAPVDGGPAQQIVASEGGEDLDGWRQRANVGPQGRELFYLRQLPSGMTALMAVDIDTSRGFNAGQPRVLFEGNYSTTVPLRSYDAFPDAKRFVMLKVTGDAEPPVTSINVILNWAQQLQRRVP